MAAHHLIHQVVLVELVAVAVAIMVVVVQQEITVELEEAAADHLGLFHQHLIFYFKEEYKMEMVKLQLAGQEEFIVFQHHVFL